MNSTKICSDTREATSVWEFWKKTMDNIASRLTENPQKALKDWTKLIPFDTTCRSDGIHHPFMRRVAVCPSCTLLSRLIDMDTLVEDRTVVTIPSISRGVEIVKLDSVSGPIDVTPVFVVSGRSTHETLTRILLDKMAVPCIPIIYTWICDDITYRIEPALSFFDDHNPDIWNKETLVKVLNKCPSLAESLIPYNGFISKPVIDLVVWGSQGDPFFYETGTLFITCGDKKPIRYVSELGSKSTKPLSKLKYLGWSGKNFSTVTRWNLLMLYRSLALNPKFSLIYSSLEKEWLEKGLPELKAFSDQWVWESSLQGLE